MKPERLARIEKAAKLRRAGKSWKQIAAAVNTSPSNAQVLYHQYLRYEERLLNPHPLDILSDRTRNSIINVLGWGERPSDDSADGWKGIIATALQSGRFDRVYGIGKKALREIRNFCGVPEEELKVKYIYPKKAVITGEMVNPKLKAGNKISIFGRSLKIVAVSKTGITLSE
jgi:hypothetical protein